MSNQCAAIASDPTACLKHGSELASWFMVRLLNPGVICNFDTGDCGLMK